MSGWFERFAGSGLMLGWLMICAAAGAQAPFTPIDLSLPAVSGGAAAWGDFDRDGDLDLALAGEDTSHTATLRIFRNDGDGSLVNLAQDLAGFVLGSVAWADYDVDGDLDLAAAGRLASGTPRTIIYRNDLGTFHDAGFANLPGVFFCSLDWADVDGDGDPDLLVTGNMSGAQSVTRLFRNDRSAMTELPVGLPGLFFSAVDWGDFDGDGDPDLAIIGSSGGTQPVARIYRNDDLTFTNLDAGLLGRWRGSVQWGDYDRDGDPDLLISGVDPASAPRTTIYRNDAGTFTDINAPLLNVAQGQARWADIDRDEDLDLAVSGPAGNPAVEVTQVYRNDENTTFTAFGDLLPGAQLSAMVWGDYDLDSDPDLLIAGLSGGRPALHLLRDDLVEPLPLPLVSIRAIDASGSERDEGEADDTITFELSRTGWTGDLLMVNLRWEGLALNGFDYGPMLPWAIIPEYAETVLVTVTMINDDLVEGEESLNLVVQASNAYQTAPPPAAMAAIGDNDHPSDLMTLILPAAGETWYSGLDGLVKWWVDVEQVGTALRFELRRNGQFVAYLGEGWDPDGDGSASLPIPMGIASGNDYTVRAISNWNPSLSVESAPFRIAQATALEPALRVVSPNGGESLRAGRYTRFQWRSRVEAAGSAVRLELWRRVATVGYGWDQTGQDASPVTLPRDVVPGGHYKLRAVSTWAPRLYDETDDFMIIAPPTLGAIRATAAATAGAVLEPAIPKTPPDVRVIEPTWRTVWHLGKTGLVHWSNLAETAGTAVRIELWRHGMKVRELGTPWDPSGQGVFVVEVPADLAPATDYVIRAVSLWNPALWGESTPFAIARPVAIVTPNGGETHVPGETFDVQWVSDLTDAGSGVRFELWQMVEPLGEQWQPEGRGDHMLLVPEGAPGDDEYTVRAISTWNPLIQDESDGFFRIYGADEENAARTEWSLYE